MLVPEDLKAITRPMTLRALGVTEGIYDELKADGTLRPAKIGKAGEAISFRELKAAGARLGRWALRASRG